MSILKDIISTPSKYRKFYAALTAPLGVLLIAMAPTELEAAFQVTSVEWYQTLAALAAAIGVYGVTNKKG